MVVRAGRIRRDRCGTTPEHHAESSASRGLRQDAAESMRPGDRDALAVDYYLTEKPSMRFQYLMPIVQSDASVAQ
jgi:hypothetical protein